MSNVHHKTLEALEHHTWPSLKEYPSRLVERCHALRKVPVGQLTVEDLRLLIGQEIGLQYLIPLAIEILRNNPLAEGDFYPGDLLKSVLSVNESYWSVQAEQKAEVSRIAGPVREHLPK